MDLKKIGTLALTGALSLSLAAPAFAADTPNTSTTITGAYQDIDIDVTVPATGTVVVNPYGLPVEYTKSDSTVKKITGQQITTAPMAIMNNTDLDLDVSVTVTGTAQGSLKFSTTSNADSTTPANNAFVYLQAQPLTIADGTTGMTNKADDSDTLDDAVIDGAVAWAAAEYNADTDVVVGTTKVTKDGFVTLKAAEVTPADNSDPDSPVAAYSTYKSGSIALVRLAGDLSPVVKTPWKESKEESSSGAGDAVVGDGFTVKVAYTFAPAVAE